MADKDLTGENLKTAVETIAAQSQVKIVLPAGKTFSCNAVKFKAAAGACAVLVVALAGCAGYFGYDYYKYR